MSNVIFQPSKRGVAKRKERERHIARVLLEQTAGLEDRATRHRFVRFARGKGKDQEKILRDFIVAQADIRRSLTGLTRL